MLILNRLDIGSLANNFNKFLASVSVLVHLANVSRRYLFRQRDVDGQVDTAEPGSAAIRLIYDDSRKEKGTGLTHEE